MTKIFCNLCGVEVIPDGSDVMVVGKLIEPMTDIQDGRRKIRETELHLCAKCSKNVLKDIINGQPEKIITKA